MRQRRGACAEWGRMQGRGCRALCHVVTVLDFILKQQKDDEGFMQGSPVPRFASLKEAT